MKTAEEAALWGGTAGQQYDPCYHLACDNYANVNETALDVNSDAVAYGILQYGMSTAEINGLRAKGNFRTPAGSGGGLPGGTSSGHEDHVHNETE